MTRLSLLPFSSPENKYKRVLTNLTDRDCLLFVTGPVTQRRSYKMKNNLTACFVGLTLGLTYMALVSAYLS